MLKQIRIEVLNTMVHLLICIMLIAAYVVLRLNGIEDSVLKDSIIMAVAYFFGASSASLITNTLSQKSSSNVNRDSVDTTSKKDDK